LDNQDIILDNTIDAEALSDVAATSEHEQNEVGGEYEPLAAIDSTKIAPASNIYKWYVLHTYSGYESMVKDNLEMVFKKNNLENRLDTISIPMEDFVEEKNGRKKIVKRKLFPCYVYVKMDYDNSLWHMITKTRGVTGFVGPQGRALALTNDEVKRLKLEVVKVLESDFKVGDKVRITAGSFEGNDGEIESIDSIKGRVKLKVEAFGRSTSIEVEMSQVETI